LASSTDDHFPRPLLSKIIISIDNETGSPYDQLVVDLPVPDIRSSECILCVQPHPDDTDIAVGASIASLADNGARVVYVSVTDDAAGLLGSGAELSYGERVAIRRREQRSAADILGVTEVIELGFPDAGRWDTYDAREAIVEVIHQVRPDTVLTVDPWMRYEAHRDHQKAGFAATEAAILYGFRSVGGETSADWSIRSVGLFFTENPNTFLDVASWRDAKHRALACHASQWTEESFEELITYDTWRGRQYGSEIGCEYAEALMMIPPAWLHIFPDVVALATRGQRR
jgi:N,N'-diacetylchitobiose non-reducing end deacetylase